MKRINLKQEITKVLEQNGLKIGCYNIDNHKFTEYQKKKIINELKTSIYDDRDIKFKDFVIEVWYVDNEVDFEILSKEEYKDRYL